MLDDIKAQRWEREAQEMSVQFFDPDDRACRLPGIALVLLDDRHALLKYISRSQAK